MKRMVIMATVLALLLSLTAAGTAEEETALEQVLRGSTEFYLTDAYTGEGKAMLLPQDGHWDFLGDSEGNTFFSRYAFLDLDGDGMMEAALEISERWEEEAYLAGYLILREQDGAVYGFEMYIRAMNELKADGSFLYSNGAMDNGYAFLRFEDGLPVLEPFTYCESDWDTETVFYYVDGQIATEAEFGQATLAQDEKPEPDWMPFLPSLTE